MSSDEIVLSVKNVSKCFEMYDKPVHRLFQTLTMGKKTFYKEFWALRDISFEVRRGDCVGIIGRNGAGKSTLLQIITGTLQPTCGSVEIKGRVAALLELGSGFNPEFTGRENVYMNAAILGLSKSEIDAKYDEIVAFADIGEFIDQPIKTYSSGMMVRLAFAVNVHVDADILIVDEALAVGDAAFQRKCFMRIERIKERGTTILFVSHALDDVAKNCVSAMLLDCGRQIAFGSARQVVNMFRDLLFGKSNVSCDDQDCADIGLAGELSPDVNDIFHTRPLYQKSEYRWGMGGAKIIDFAISCRGELFPHTIKSGSMMKLRYRVHFERSVANILYGLLLKTVEGINIYGTNSTLLGRSGLGAGAGEVVDCEFSLPAMLNAGCYFVSFGVTEDLRDGNDYPLDRRYDGVMINIAREEPIWGLFDMNADCVVEKQLEKP